MLRNQKIDIKYLFNLPFKKFLYNPPKKQELYNETINDFTIYSGTCLIDCGS